MLFAPGDGVRMDSWVMVMLRTGFNQHLLVHLMARKLNLSFVVLIIQQHILNLNCKSIVGVGMLFIFSQLVILLLTLLL